MACVLFAALMTLKVLSFFGASSWFLWNILNAIQMLMIIPIYGLTLPDSLRNFFDGFDFDFLPNFFESFVTDRDVDSYKTYRVAADYDYDSAIWVILLGSELSFTLICLAMWAVFWPLSKIPGALGRLSKKATD